MSASPTFPVAQRPGLAAVVALLLCAVVAQGLGALAHPAWPRVLAEWGTVAIPVMFALGALAWVSRQDVLWACPVVPALAQAARHRRAMWLLTLGTAVVFFAAALQRHRAYESNAFDLGDWHQVIWNTGHGHPFATSLMTWEDERWLAWHFTLTLALFSPLTWISDGAGIILAAQSVLLCLGAVAVHRFAVRRLGGGALPLVFGAAYLMSPLLRGANWYEFHEICLSVPCLAFALDALDERRYLRALPLVVLGCLTKESTALAFSGVGLSLFLRGPSWRGRVGGFLFMGAMLAWFFVSMTVIAPSMGELGGEFFYLFRFGNLGRSVGEIVENLLTHPWRFVTVPLENPEKLLYLLRTLGPFAFLPLLAPTHLAAAVPTYLMNTLGQYRPMHSIHYHYGAEMVPALVMAAAAGAARLLAWAPLRGWSITQSRRNTGYALVALSLALYGPSELARARLFPRTPTHEAYDAMLARIPPDAAVSCQTVFCPHLSARRYLYLFPRLTGRSDGPDGSLTRARHPEAAARAIRAAYVVVDTARPQPSYWQVPEQFLPSVAALESQGYRERDRVGTAVLYRLEAAPAR